jgi:hypothetical protein
MRRFMEARIKIRMPRRFMEARIKIRMPYELFKIDRSRYFSR